MCVLRPITADAGTTRRAADTERSSSPEYAVGLPAAADVRAVVHDENTLPATAQRRSRTRGEQFPIRKLTFAKWMASAPPSSTASAVANQSHDGPGAASVRMTEALTAATFSPARPVRTSRAFRDRRHGSYPFDRAGEFNVDDLAVLFQGPKTLGQPGRGRPTRILSPRSATKLRLRGRLSPDVADDVSVTDELAVALIRPATAFLP